MKRLIGVIMCLFLLVNTVFAAEGEMGSFGGITPGVRLPTLTSWTQTTSKTTSSKYTLAYKENIYLSGAAETVTGTIEIKPGKEIDKTKGEGSYTETYKVVAQNETGTVRLNRSMTLETQYIYEASRNQITRVTTAKKWTEVVTVNGKSYQLDSDKSYYSKSVLEDETPGVNYYRGDVYYEAYFGNVGNAGEESYIIMSVSGAIYGYDQVYAKTETQRRTITIQTASGMGYAIEETPTYTVYRDIEYGANEPTAISMSGNYKEIIRSEGVLSYTILQGNATLYEDEYSGMMSVEASPSIEQLSIPSSLNLQGHPAETQIKKMYSMKIIDESPSTYSPNQALTRKEYIKMLVIALQMPLPEVKTSSSRDRKSVV